MSMYCCPDAPPAHSIVRLDLGLDFQPREERPQVVGLHHTRASTPGQVEHAARGGLGRVDVVPASTQGSKEAKQVRRQCQR